MSKLKSLADHNSQCETRPQNSVPHPNGIACPACGKELWDSNPSLTLTSNPPKKNVHCGCGYHGYRLA